MDAEGLPLVLEVAGWRLTITPGDAPLTLTVNGTRLLITPPARSDRAAEKVEPTDHADGAPNGRFGSVDPTCDKSDRSPLPPLSSAAPAAAAVAAAVLGNGHRPPVSSVPDAPAPAPAGVPPRARAPEREAGPQLDSTGASKLVGPTVARDEPPPPPLEPGDLAELLVVAGHLRDAIASHRPGITPRLETWIEDLRHAIRRDRLTPLELAQAAWQAHLVPDPKDGKYFWRDTVRSGLTLRKHAPELLRQRDLTAPGKRAPPVPVCPRCSSLQMGAPSEIPLTCSHGHVWIPLVSYRCARDGSLLTWVQRGGSACPSCQLPHDQLPENVLAGLRRLNARPYGEIPCPAPL